MISSKHFGLLLLLITSTLIGSGCSTIDFVTGQKVNNIYSLTEDVTLGSDIYQQMIAETKKDGCKVDADPVQVKKIRDMVNRITKVSHLPDLPYEVVLIHTNIVNAFAAPGGKIIVLEGLYDPKEGIVHSDDELAAVIAHEVAHVTCRHSTEEMTRSMPAQLLLGLAAIYASVQEDEGLQLLVGGAFVAYQGLIVTMYSRENEQEADRVGLDYMARAGYDPTAAPRLWKRIYEKQGGTPKLLSILSTHPRDEDRAKYLEGALPAALEIYARTKGGRLEPVPRVVADEFGGAAGQQTAKP